MVFFFRQSKITLKGYKFPSPSFYSGRKSNAYFLKDCSCCGNPISLPNKKQKKYTKSNASRLRISCTFDFDVEV